MNKITEIQISTNHPLSKKMEELSNIIKNKEDDKSYILYSDEQKKIISKKENNTKLKNLVLKEIKKFFKRINKHVDDNNIKILQKEYNKKIKQYDKNIGNERKIIDKLEKQQKKKLNNILLKSLKNYKKSINDKDLDELLLFIPVLDQPFEIEYDFNLFFDKKILTKKNKDKYLEIMFEYNKEISKKYLDMVGYMEENKIIEEYKKLNNLIQELKTKRILFTNKWIDILDNPNKIKKYIKVENYKKLYKDEIFLWELVANKQDKKLNKIFISLNKNYFKDNKYNKKYIGYEWYIIEEFYKKEDNDFLTKKEKELFIKNKDLLYYVSKNNKSIVIREEKRKNIKYIRKILQEILINLWLKDFINYTKLKDFEYIDIIKDNWEKEVIQKERIFEL